MPDPNRERLEGVAEKLGSLNTELVYVGGAVIGLLITDPAAPTVRFTSDIDCIVSLATRAEYDGRLRRELNDKGFRVMQGKDIPICAWTDGHVRLDIMPDDESILGFTNQWYRSLIETANSVQLSRIMIRVGHAPFVLASKIEAFEGRGGGDYFGSRDMEDIIALVDGRRELMTEIQKSSTDLRRFLAESFRKYMNVRDFRESLSGHLIDAGRGPTILARIREITSV